jgi:hypothetical protein
MLQTLKLNNEIRKKSSFYEEKSLVRLTPGGHLICSFEALQSNKSLLGKSFQNQRLAKENTISKLQSYKAKFFLSTLVLL